ncbi:MAG TPA: hypothetical protein DCS93_12670 [Microscillaceae bacterium]|nr:hypothetical protein [Microscillaceae bacterium]
MRRGIQVLILIALVWGGTRQAQAQKSGKAEILNVTLDGQQEKIRIDFNLKASRKARFLVQLFYSKDGGKTFEGPMKSVLGDAGENITPGKEKKIYWDFLIDDPNFEGKNISFKIKAFLMNPSIKAIPRGGPANALLSLVAPGLGDMRVRSGGLWYGVITVGAFTTLGTGLYLRASARNNYDSYQNARDAQSARDLLNKANQQNNLSTVLINAAIAIWVVDVALVAWRGFKNQKLKRQKISLGLSPVGNQAVPTLGFSLKF